MKLVLSMARTQIVRRRIVFRTPPRASVEEVIPEGPMAYVEETITEEPFQVPPGHFLFTVPDNWNPPSDFREETSMPAIAK
jgi:hypothetical protein